MGPCPSPAVARRATLIARSDRNGVLHSYRFDDIKTTDDDSLVTATEQTTKGAGSIRVSIRRLHSVMTAIEGSVTKEFSPSSPVFRASEIPLMERWLSRFADEASKSPRGQLCCGLR